MSLWEKIAREGAEDNLKDLGFRETATFSQEEEGIFEDHLNALRSNGKKPAVDYALVLREEEKIVITNERVRGKVKLMKVFER